MARKNKKNPARSPRTPSPANSGDRAGSLWEKLIESGLTYFVSFVLGTTLFGGCGYLLFNEKAEALALDREMLNYGRFANEDKAAREMAGFWNSDGSSRMEPLTRIEKVVKRLSDGVTDARLDDEFVRETSIWTAESISRIASLIGIINGYAFGDELYKNLQQDYTKELDAEKSLLSDVAVTVKNWNQTPVERRTDRLRQIVGKHPEVNTAIAEIESRSLRVLKRIDDKFAENDQKFNELKNQNSTLTRKKLFARMGITLGGALVLLAITRRLIKRKK
jgi:hypothetical protein